MKLDRYLEQAHDDDVEVHISTLPISDHISNLVKQSADIDQLIIVGPDNPDFVAEDAIAWLTLPMAGVQEGPTGGDTLTKTTFIQRLNTSGGLAPADGCASLEDVGAKAFRPYTADYFFYSHDGDN